MSAHTSVVALQTSRALPDPNYGQTQGPFPGLALLTAAGPSSYDTSGSILDLSKWFDSVPTLVSVFNPGGPEGLYVAGATAALGKVKYLNRPVGAAVERSFKEIIPVENVLIVPGSNGTLSRVNEAGAVSILQTVAGGANTTIWAVPLAGVVGTGSGLGRKITTLTIGYEVSADADLTSVDVTFDIVTYAQATAPAVTANALGAIVDGSYDADHNTAAKRADKDVTGGEHLMVVTPPTPIYFSTANSDLYAKITVVSPDTGDFKLRFLQAAGTELLSAVGSVGTELASTTNISAQTMYIMAHGLLKPPTQNS